MWLCFELPFLNNNIVVSNIHRPQVTLVSSVFPNAINYFILKMFPGTVIYFS